MIIIAQLIREQHLDATYILLPNKAWGRTQRECGAWSRARWWEWRLPFANLHSSAHRWCHELCFMQNDKVQTKIIKETERLLNIGMQDSQEET